MHRCWFVTLDPEYPSWLSPLTGSRTSGPAIFAIYLLLVIGLTGESQAEHKRMLFMDAWKKGKGKGETFLRWQPLLDFSIAIRSIAVRNRRFRVFRTKFFHSELWNRVLFEFLILYPNIRVRCLSWRDWGREKGEIFKGGLFSEGEISFIGIRIRWYSFTMESQGWKQFEFVEICLDLIERYFETKLLIGADPNLIFVDFLNNENVFEIKIL